MPTLVQTLHGYDRGHRLLASSRGLDERELALLERLSDLSGYLPTGSHFDSYFTGFPCGRYYALACTWLDVSATRAGTVLTHTLLLPLGEASSIEDLWGLTRFHRRPQGADGRQSYSEPLLIQTVPEAPKSQLSSQEAVAAVVLLLGTEDRPILWVDERQPDHVVRFLWSLQRAEGREQFSFCTFALQPRTVEARPFTFLGLPPTARGSFLAQADSESWWDIGRLRHERMLGMTPQGWAQAVASRGAKELRGMEKACITSGLPLRALKEVPMLWRFMELEAAATKRLPAARSRADLFERLWPELPPTHPAAEPVLRLLLDRQGDAALEPRPLWELTDFLRRPLVRGRRQSDAAFASLVEQVLETEVERRLTQVPELTLEALPDLLEAAGPQGGDSVLAVIQRVLTTSLDAAERLMPQLLQVAERLLWPALVQVGLSALSPPERLRALESVPKASSREALLKLVESAAEQLVDLELLLAVGRLHGRELEALHRVTQLLLPQGPGTIEKALASLRTTVHPAVLLAWALETSEPDRLAWHAAEEGARAAQQLGLALDELVRRCSGTPNGARVLLVLATQLPRVESLEQALRQTPTLALDVLVRSFREEWSWRANNLKGVALELLPAEQLLAPELLQVLRSPLEQWRTRGLMRRVGPQWLKAVNTAAIPDDALADWLSIAPLRQWLRDATRSQLQFDTRTSGADDLLPGLCRVLRYWLRKYNPSDTYWIIPLLDRLLDDVATRNLDKAAEDLAALLRYLLRPSSNIPLATKVLSAVARSPMSSGWHLVEQVFPPVYASVLRNEHSLLGVFASAFTGKHWDKAKLLRRWLIDAYVTNQWPPESFLRCMQGDTHLFFVLVSRAVRINGGLAFLRALPGALQSRPELAERWRHPIEEALVNPHRISEPD